MTNFYLNIHDVTPDEFDSKASHHTNDAKIQRDNRYQTQKTEAEKKSLNEENLKEIKSNLSSSTQQLQ